MMKAFLHGLILAFGLILPLGMQNVFILTQGAVQRRWRHALPAVLTASLCDTLLIFLAVLGVSLVWLGSAWLKTTVMGAGILFLLYMGWSTWKSAPAAGGSEAAERFPPRKQIAFAASVSLLNPHAIFDTIGVIGTGSLRYTGMEKAIFAGACIVVSWIWFVGLSLAGRVVGRFDGSGGGLRWMNRISALLIWGVGGYMLMKLFRDWLP
ncbi:LysE/ArgO family amino acid transporter [Geobacillus subterraneus]|uniref:LysE/ArgO family amino acid transporter n=1 Tax=Geobacillus subterraneus TaxID=129338 RepID=UPI001442DF42|nr:LysE/ArgO family amino acid transporter [Geobacillus subterraneus]QIZ67761.1 amino acid transporter [Geobacillus subterraneus]